jgi:redox-regulated HSP33 family molecular chaperone
MYAAVQRKAGISHMLR